MPPPIITVENLSKSYLVGHQSARSESYTALREVVGRNLKNFGRKAWDMACGRQIVQGDEIEKFWALKDVSFDIQEGAVVGIIGPNGAGKSTLLKILSRITEPTTGRVILRGRVASLLEVGTGFHPELSGRENIFLNGAILGMTRSEIKRRFDEIVGFAGVVEFLDTPVKRYSSGMYVRLAFAVAAHLDPEILVVDEVLAVGDTEFQKKCLGKMRDVAAGGRTVLFVSHNLAAVSGLCEAGILLNKGRVEAIGPATQIVGQYARNGHRSEQVALPLRKDRDGTGMTRITSIELCTKTAGAITPREPLTFRLSYSSQSPEKLARPRVVIGLYDLNEVSVFRFDSELTSDFPTIISPQGTFVCHTAPLPTTAGILRMNVAVFVDGTLQDHVVNAYEFAVVEYDFFEASRTLNRSETLFLIEHQWDIENPTDN